MLVSVTMQQLREAVTRVNHSVCFFWYFCVTVLYFVLVCFRIYIEADKIAKLDGTEVYTISQHWKVYASAQNFPVLCQQRIPQEKPIVVIS